MTNWTLPLLGVVAALQIIVLIVVCLQKKGTKLDMEQRNFQLQQELSASINALLSMTKSEIISAIGTARGELTATQQAVMSSGIEALTASQTHAATLQDTRLKELTERVEKGQEQSAKSLVDKLTAFQQSQNQAMQSLEKTISELTALQGSAQSKQFEMQDSRLKEISQLLTQAQNELQQSVSKQLTVVCEQFVAFQTESKSSMESIRKTVENRLETLRGDNTAQLEKMRLTVDEKLQKTLDTRISQSFQMVSDRLQEVYQGLGEMKTLATGVGDLKKVLSNVKTRGIIGEYQLGAIIEEMLSKEQYDENVATKKGATTRVEYAIKLPGDGTSPIYLPIDAKFPGDAYLQLVDAYEGGDTEQIATAKTALSSRMKQSAKDIHDKYIDPPHTTDFAIMFLPFEGLYAEVVRDGLVDELQRKYKVNIAGPTTFAALLNSLQMGFKTLAIQKRSSEVWNVLSAVKTEFATFETVLTAAKKRMEQTSAELDKLVGVRTRKINAKLRTVSTLPESTSTALFDEVVELPPEE